MDENRNPFDSTQSNSNPSEPQQTGSHTTPSTEWPQRGLPANRRVSITNQGKNIGTQNRISKKEVLISRRTNGTLPIRRFFGNREPSGQQAPRDSYGQQYPYGTGQPNSWNQNDNGGSFPNWNGQYWQNGAGFQPSPSGWPPQEPKQKMSVGVKVFIVILAVLAVSFIGGFAGFGIYVVVQQQDGTSSESKR